VKAKIVTSEDLFGLTVSVIRVLRFARCTNSVWGNFVKQNRGVITIRS